MLFFFFKQSKNNNNIRSSLCHRRWKKKAKTVGRAYQVNVPWLRRVAFQSLLPQALHQQRNHSMVAAGEQRGVAEKLEV